MTGLRRRMSLSAGLAQSWLSLGSDDSLVLARYALRRRAGIPTLPCDPSRDQQTRSIGLQRPRPVDHYRRAYWHRSSRPTILTVSSRFPHAKSTARRGNHGVQTFWGNDFIFTITGVGDESSTKRYPYWHEPRSSDGDSDLGQPWLRRIRERRLSTYISGWDNDYGNADSCGFHIESKRNERVSTGRRHRCDFNRKRDAGQSVRRILWDRIRSLGQLWSRYRQR